MPPRPPPEYTSVLFFPPPSPSSLSPSSPPSSPPANSLEDPIILINSRRRKNEKINSSKVYGKRKKVESPERKTSSFCLGVCTGVLLLVFLVAVYLLLSFYLLEQKCSPENFLNRTIHQTQNASKICTSSACSSAGKSIYEAANFCADPCEDFYSYACGGWIKANPISENSGALGISAFTILAAKVDHQLKELLKSKNDSKSSAKSVNIARQLYHECFDLEARKKEDFPPLHRELKYIFGTEWPILEKESSEDEEEGGVSSPKSQKILFETLMSFTLLESTPVVDFFIDTDANDTSKPIFYFTVPDGFDKDRIIYSDKTSYEAGLSIYRQSVYNMTVDFLQKGGRLNFTFEELDAELEKDEEDEDDDEDDKDKIPKNKTLKHLVERIAEALLLEEELVMATSPAEELSDPKDGYNRLSLREFNLLTNHSFNWTLFPVLFVQKFNLPHQNISEDTEVIITDLEYFKKLPKILAETPLRVLNNYLGLKFLYYFRNRTSTPEELEDWCLALVTENFDLAVSRLYVEEHVPKDAKALAEDMISKIRTSFRELLKTEASIWLDSETQARALEKEQATKYETAYAEFILDDQKLDEHYGLLNESSSNLEVKPGHFFESVLDLRRHRMITYSRRMNYMIRDNKIGAANINAYANKYKNEIMLPAAMLQAPFFDVGRPAYLNLASMGAIIGHEITHHFDSEGRAFSSDGRMINWWTKETEVHFEQAAQCFSEQYSEVVDLETGRSLNGNATLAENMADNGGLRSSWRAFRSSEGKGNKVEEVPPQLHLFTPEQLFFIVYAQTWCAAYRNNATLAYVIDTDEHAPEQYRVNLPLSNFGPFSRAFGCPKEAKMNRPSEKRCMLW